MSTSPSILLRSIVAFVLLFSRLAFADISVVDWTYASERKYTDVTIPVPAKTQAGDLLVIFIGCSGPGFSQFPSAPQLQDGSIAPDWNLIINETTAGKDLNGWAYYKTYSHDNIFNPSYVISDGKNMFVSMIALRGVEVAIPIVEASAGFNTMNGTSGESRAPEVTAEKGGMVLAAFIYDDPQRNAQVVTSGYTTLLSFKATSAEAMAIGAKAITSDGIEGPIDAIGTEIDGAGDEVAISVSFRGAESQSNVSPFPSAGPSFKPSSAPSMSSFPSSKPSSKLSAMPSESPISGPFVETLLSYTNFDKSWDGWVDGGVDSRRSQSDAQYCKGGIGRCVRLRDNSYGESSTYREFTGLSSYACLRIEFWFNPMGFENDEDFYLEYCNSLNDAQNEKECEIIGQWVNVNDFVNGQAQDAEVAFNLPGGDNIVLRFRCDGSDNSDIVYIDDVKVFATNQECVDNVVNILKYKPTPELVGDLTGFASIEGYGISRTTGGDGAPIVVVDNREAFIKAIKNSQPQTVLVDGMIDMFDPACPCKTDFAVGSDKTIVGIGERSGLKRGGLKISGIKFEKRLDYASRQLQACICPERRQVQEEEKVDEEIRYPANITELPDDAVQAGNVIIRNLVFEDCPNDCIGAQHFAHHIWIDHNHFKNSGDGAIDIKTGSDLITVSWNRFRDTDKTMLCGHNDDNAQQDQTRLRTTYHHNYFEETRQRHPRVRFAEPVHVYNNYYKRNGAYGVGSSIDAGVVIEANYFEDVEKPILTVLDDEEDIPGRIMERMNMYIRSGSPPPSNDVVQEPALYYNYTMHEASEVPALIKEWSGTGKVY